MTVLLILVLMQLKHWYIDFVNQTDEEVKYKGVYCDWRGVKHSLKQGAATALILAIFIDPVLAMQMGALDFILHYNIDYCKMRFGNRDVKTRAFWVQLGLDQLAHQLSYIAIIWLIVL